MGIDGKGEEWQKRIKKKNGRTREGGKRRRREKKIGAWKSTGESPQLE